MKIGLREPRGSGSPFCFETRRGLISKAWSLHSAFLEAHDFLPLFAQAFNTKMHLVAR